MKKTIFSAAFCVGIAAFAMAKDRPKNDYIERFTPTALEEKNSYSIPAAISMAQGILESGWGEGRFAQYNNHFGIKCHTAWTGETFSTVDDDYDTNGNLIESCFRAYASPEESWRDHSLFLQQVRYQKLYDHGNNYRAWAIGLQSATYATDPEYAKKLISIIERYELYRLDDLSAPLSFPEVPILEKEPTPPMPEKIKQKEKVAEPNDGALFDIIPQTERSFDQEQTEKIDAPKAEFIPKDYIRGQGSKIKEGINTIWNSVKSVKEKASPKKKNWFDEDSLDEITPKKVENKDSKISFIVPKGNVYGEKVVAARK